MFRALLLYLSSANWARRIVTGWGFAYKTARRFVAGDNLDDAIAAVERLEQQGLLATLDHLGENVSNAEEAIQATDTYIHLLQRLDEVGAASGASLKLTQLGLGLDYDLCLSNMRCIAARAAEFETFVRIDMEDATTVDRTLQIYNSLQAEGFHNLGVVIQSYLYRSEVDVQKLLEINASIRLCKGAYKESPEVAFPDKRDVDSSFDKLAAMMVDQAQRSGAVPVSTDGKVPPLAAIATHDQDRIEYIKEYAHSIGLPKEALEFQMLFGIRSDLQLMLREQGYPVRVYVAYGTEWYPFFMRRLAERPANLWFFVSNFFRG